MRIKIQALLTWAALAVIIVSDRVHGAEVDVISWAFSTVVDVNGAREARHETVVQDPLDNTYLASIQNSIANSSIFAQWDSAGFLDFTLDAEHTCQGGDDVECRSSGNITFTPQLDSTLDVTGIYDHAMGNGTRTARLAISLFKLDPMSTIINTTITRNTIVHPAIGQIMYQSPPTLLTAGQSYIINYNLELSSFSGSPASLSHADGSLHIVIDPIPEPTVCLLILAALMLLSRTRRRPTT